MSLSESSGSYPSISAGITNKYAILGTTPYESISDTWLRPVAVPVGIDTVAWT
jgi:hypothetical protein